MELFRASAHMINGFGAYDYKKHQNSQLYQRPSDVRLPGPLTANNQQHHSPHLHDRMAQSTAVTLTNDTPPSFARLDFDSAQYKPSTTVWNLNKLVRRCGLPIPTRYCSKMWCVKDAAGYVAAGFTWFFIIVGEFLVVLNCLSVDKITAFTCINIGVTLAASILAFASHCKCMFSDPGTIPRGNATQENLAQQDLTNGRRILVCPKCNSIKPDRAHHCSVCQRCIRKMDHHCPWINNCVGEYNQKFFVLFTGYVCFISCYGFGISLTTIISCLTSIPRDDFIRNSIWSLQPNSCYFSMGTTLFISICLIMESLMFGLFTAIMCGTQVYSICSDQTGIETLKKETRKKKSRVQSLRDVFGGKFSIRWFSPFHGHVPTEDALHLESV